MLQHPQLKYCYRAEILDDEHVLILSEKDHAVLSGNAVVRLFSEMQRRPAASLDELVDALDGRMAALEVYYHIGLLEKKGYLCEAEPALPPETCAFWNSQGMETWRLLKVLQEKRIELEFVGIFSRTHPPAPSLEKRGGEIPLQTHPPAPSLEKRGGEIPLQTHPPAPSLGKRGGEIPPAPPLKKGGEPPSLSKRRGLGDEFSLPEIFRQAFRQLGMRLGENGDLRVVVCDDYQRKELRRIDREARESGRPWMLIKPTGAELWIGPIFAPGQSACWSCLQQRLDINRPLDALYRTHSGSNDAPAVPPAFLPQTLQTAANLSAIEIVKWLYFGENDRLEGKLLSLDIRSLESQSHVLTKRPQCPDCGDPAMAGREPQAIRLQKGSSACVVSMGGYREVPPEDTVEKYRRHISPICGVVQNLKPYFNMKDAPVYNYTSGRNLALRSKTLFWLNTHLRSTNGGKGKSWTQAKAGALCEAIERYSGVYQGDEPSILSSLEQLDGQGIHPNACMNYSERQFREREATNRACSKFYALVPVPFDESQEMEWTPVYSLTQERFKYLPSCFCYAQYPAEDEWNLLAYPDSNGGAAGNTIEEAILQGFLELVERDSVALWWYNRLRRPAVDLHSFDEPYFRQVIDYYASLKRSVYVLDLTADLRIPAFVALSHRLDDPRQEIVFGCGAHVDVKIAVERALVELNQILPLACGPERDRAQGKYRINDENFVQWLSTATMENQPYLVPHDGLPLKTAADYPRLCEATIYDSVRFCIDAAAEQGVETLVLDLTRPDVGLPVVKVVAPGLRHFWKRLAPGRLYDVPVKLGWLDTALKEEELNPIGLFI